MIKLITDCEKCSHKKVCGNKGNPEEAMVRLSNDVYGEDPNKMLRNKEHVKIGIDWGEGKDVTAVW